MNDDETMTEQADIYLMLLQRRAELQDDYRLALADYLGAVQKKATPTTLERLARKVEAARSACASLAS